MGLKNIPETHVCTYFAQGIAPTVDWRNAARVSIIILPDIALLEIFDFYLGRIREEEEKLDAWLKLAHVCQKWRYLVFGSPLRLGVRLWYKDYRPLEGQLDIWPSLPIAVWTDTEASKGSDYDVNNIIAAFDSEYNNRICTIGLWNFPGWQMEQFLAAMHRPFPALTYLSLGLDVYEHMMESLESPLSVVSDSFLGGSAPLLEKLTLHYIPFPGLPKLLLSATRLVKLDLTRIPHSVYLPPEVLVDCLSVLTKLEILNVGFDKFDGSLPSRVDQNSRSPSPLTRIHLPVLTELWFKGASKYLEDIVARIDAPLLDTLRITFFHEPIIDTAQLTQFIDRAPELKTRDEARVVFYHREVSVALPLPKTNNVPPLKLGISYKQTDLQLSSLARMCDSSFPQNFIPAVKLLDIIWNEDWHSEDSDGIETGEWLELLRSFTAVKGLYISREAVSRSAPALQELGERMTELLPSLDTLFLDEQTSGPVQESIAKFVSARQLAGHPISISYESRIRYILP